VVDCAVGKCSMGNGPRTVSLYDRCGMSAIGDFPMILIREHPLRRARLFGSTLCKVVNVWNAIRNLELHTWPMRGLYSGQKRRCRIVRSLAVIQRWNPNHCYYPTSVDGPTFSTVAEGMWVVVKSCPYALHGGPSLRQPGVTRARIMAGVLPRIQYVNRQRYPWTIVRCRQCVPSVADSWRDR
jgi:hypothetical protein